MKKFKKFFKRFILSLFFLFAIICFHIYSPYFLIMVDGDSMNPTFHSHQILLFTKKIDELKLNDIVIFKYNGEIFIKRITGKTGDIYIESKYQPLGYFLVQGDYSKLFKNKYYDFKKIKQHEFYVRGDNRGISFDSDSFGPIKKSQILGKIFKMYN